MYKSRSAFTKRVTSTWALAQHNEQRARFLDVVVRDTADRPHESDEKAYVEYIEQQISSFIQRNDPTFKGVCELFGPVHQPSDRVNNILDLCASVLRCLASLSAKTSIDDLANAITEQFRIEQEQSVRYRMQLHQLIFASIGWTSMLFTPALKPENGKFSVASHDMEEGERSSSQDPSKRPLMMLLSSIDATLSPCDAKSGNTEDLPALTTTILSLSSLRRFGKISIVWVDDMASHCQFDPKQRTLQIFRFPSRCMQILDKKVLANTLSKLLGMHCEHCSRASAKFIHDLMLEILLSYRLLFGQDSKSRKLCRRLIVTRSVKEADRILLELCTQPLSNSPVCLSRLKERDEYEPKHDFQILGHRLAEVQQFVQKPKPKKFIDALHDRRDQQWVFNFWAVLIIGGATILIGIVQIVLAAVQLAWTVSPAVRG